MFNKYFKKVVLVIFLFSLLANFYLVQSVSAADSNPSAKASVEEQLNVAGSPWGEGKPTGNNSLGGIVATAIQAFLGLLGIIFLVLIIYAGFNWMTAQGEEEKVTKAKETLQRAVIGLIIIIAAYSITYFVFNALPSGGSGIGSGGVVGGS